MESAKGVFQPSIKWAPAMKTAKEMMLPKEDGISVAVGLVFAPNDLAEESGFCDRYQVIPMACFC